MARRDRRQEIMQAAEQLFTARRFHEITTDEVAQAAGVGKGTIYRYFQDKEDLFFQTAMAGFDELCDLVRQKVPGCAPFRAQLVEACEQMGAFFARRRQWFRMMQAEDFRMAMARGALCGRWMEHRKRLVAAVADVIRKGVAEKAVRTDLAPEVLASFLLGMLRTRARDLEDEPEVVRRYAVVVDLFLRGSSAPAHGAAVGAGDGLGRRLRAPAPDGRRATAARHGRSAGR